MNEEHLAYIERFVRAGQRRDRTQRLFNGVLAEQFPKWMVLAKNRSDVLQTVERLRARSV